jgi:hypothetical protein
MLTVPPSKFFGFLEAGNPSADPFCQSPFYAGSAATLNYELSDAAFRAVIMAKASSNICNGSVQAINEIMLRLFPNRGNCWVQDNGNMTITYTFGFTLTAVEMAIVAVAGVLPQPAGVGVFYAYV